MTSVGAWRAHVALCRQLCCLFMFTHAWERSYICACMRVCVCVCVCLRELLVAFAFLRSLYYESARHLVNRPPPQLMSQELVSHSRQKQSSSTVYTLDLTLTQTVHTRKRFQQHVLNAWSCFAASAAVSAADAAREISRRDATPPIDLCRL